MGWTFCHEWTTRSHVIAAIKQESVGSRWSIVDEAAVAYGKHWWVLLKGTFVPQPGGYPDHPVDPMTGEITVGIIVLYLLETSDGSWGYKDVSEEMGPYESDCPASLVKKAAAIGPAVNEYASNFRARILNFATSKKLAAAKVAGLKPGDHFRWACREYIFSHRVRRSIAATRITGDGPFRFGPSRFGGIEVIDG